MLRIRRKGSLKYFITASMLIVTGAILMIYSILFGPGISPTGERTIFYIPAGSTYEQVLDTIGKNLVVKNIHFLKWVAKKKKYPASIKPGRFMVESEMSYVSFINMLRSGNQAPVRVTFNNIRTIYDLAGKVGGQIEADSASIADFLSYPGNYSEDGFSRETVIAAFIPDTYELFWNTDAQGFYRRMVREYRKFWNGERMAKAGGKNLDPVEVAILASIIDDEVAKADEKPRIAGVYLNRLRRGMPLQACPTIKFALNDFTITRVLNKHLQIDSPYNTYKYPGFPPGPIGCPTKDGLEAVLNAEEHEYIFFAARADFSGYHNFSRTLAEHNRYANIYQKELDRRRIYK